MESLSNEQVKAKIIEAINAFRAEGGRLVRDGFGVISEIEGKWVAKGYGKDRCGCAVSALINGTVCERPNGSMHSGYTAAAAKLLERDQEWMWAFIAGFDGEDFERLDHEAKKFFDAYQMGREVAAETKPGDIDEHYDE